MSQIFTCGLWFVITCGRVGSLVVFEDLWNFSQSEHIIGPGSHVEYPTVTKNSNFVEDHPRNILAKFGNASFLKPLGQLKPNCPWMIIGRSFTNLLFFMPIGNPRWPKHFPHRVQCKIKSCRSRHFEFHIGTKNCKIVEDHPMNMHVEFGCLCFLCRSEIQDGRHCRT
jgi:hypothetical protein